MKYSSVVAGTCIIVWAIGHQVGSNLDKTAQLQYVRITIFRNDTDAFHALCCPVWQCCKKMMMIWY